MKAKDYLQQLQKLDKLIENKMVERSRWVCIATATTVPLGVERVQSSGNHQKVSNAVCSYTDLEAEIDECIKRLACQRKEIISTIEMLEVAEYDLLHKIYVQYLSLQDAATALDKSYTWVTTMHGTALKHIQQILDERECEKV